MSINTGTELRDHLTHALTEGNTYALDQAREAIKEWLITEEERESWDRLITSIGDAIDALRMEEGA